MMNAELDRKGLLAWAQRAEHAGLSSLGAGERIAWQGQDGFTALAVAAGATQRIRLVSCVLAAPLHPAGVLAKQAASLDVLSGGRLSLGLGISSRPDDFAAAPAPWQGRAAHFEQQLVWLKRAWAGEAPAEGVLPIGPRPVQPGGPELLIGAFVDAALQRAGRLADGILTWSFAPDAAFHARALATAAQARRAEGRDGSPRLVASIYFALGPEAEAKMERFLNHYYGYLDASRRRAMFEGITTFAPATLREVVRSYAEAGVDEVLFSPTIASADQVDRLAEAVAA
jgi:alkanesulfonate monooxygenase SsuD/methylene tetrahydromethanopterin reductase-like flavin-dependent oxidoreductase (luciferase family)